MLQLHEREGFQPSEPQIKVDIRLDAQGRPTTMIVESNFCEFAIDDLIEQQAIALAERYVLESAAFGQPDGPAPAAA